MIKAISLRIAQELSVREAQVNAAIKLLDEGATVPFIARYRKEITGALDDTQMRQLEERTCPTSKNAAPRPRLPVKQGWNRWQTPCWQTRALTRKILPSPTTTSMRVLQSAKRRWMAPARF